ncbi:hypothetical protein FISHEDRAFT_28287, partial [Fistulina hepatica ATCC 64428]
FTLVNSCSSSVEPVIADTRCGYSPRCDTASSYSGSQPGTLAAGSSTTVTIDDDWVGRVFNQDGSCGSSGENCSLTEFNLDTGNTYAEQAYDISNIQGYTQALAIAAEGCDTVTCTSEDCPCSEAYPVGDMTGCGDDAPVRACGAGDISFTGK